MGIEPRSRFLTTICLAGASLLLSACGPDAGESRSPNTEDDNATQATAPTETAPTSAGIPTNASVQAYCDAFKGDAATLADATTTGEAADVFEDVLDKQRETGTPSTMPKETRQVFIDYLMTAENFIADLRKLPEDSPVSAMRTDKEFYAKWGGKLETPQEVRDYSAENC